MSYMLRNGWHCHFLEADLKTPLPRKLNFPSPEKIVETAERGGYVTNLEDTGIGTWYREGSGRYLASLNGGAIPETKK